MWTHSAFSFHFSYKYHYSNSKCIYFHLLLAPIKGKGYNLYWFRIDNKHMTEPWLDQALMESAYKCGMRKINLSGQIIGIQNIFFLNSSSIKGYKFRLKTYEISISRAIYLMWAEKCTYLGLQKRVCKVIKGKRVGQKQGQMMKIKINLLQKF